MKTGSASNVAIEIALQAPPIHKAAAVKVAAEVTLFKKALDMQGKAALQLLAAAEGVGTQINTYG